MSSYPSTSSGRTGLNNPGVLSAAFTSEPVELQDERILNLIDLIDLSVNF